MPTAPHLQVKRSHLWVLSVLAFLFLPLLYGCGGDGTTQVVKHEFSLDSIYSMYTDSVDVLISDSGKTQYRMVALEWYIYEKRERPCWVFPKGFYAEKFDDKKNKLAQVKCDTAYYYDQQRLWELRGRVRVKTKDGVRFYSEELFRDENRHELYSNKFSRLITPDRQLQGNYFRSDERMTKYYVSNSKGSFARTDIAGKNDSLSSAPDTLKETVRPSAMPQRKLGG